MSEFEFQSVPQSELPALSSFQDRTLFQTDEWINFIKDSQHAESVSARIVREGEVVGRFRGLVVRKFGLKLLGAPFPGWTTSYMGFNVQEGIDRAKLLEPFRNYAFTDLGCTHFELMDRQIEMSSYRSLRFPFRELNSYEIDLSQSEEKLFAAMSSACRRCIKKAEKCGVHIEVANGENFAAEYYSQLRDVFAKQKLTPTYDEARVRTLIQHLENTGNLLLVRALDPLGMCIASGIFPAFNDTMFFWGGASYRDSQNLRPNEAIQWAAMKYWKNRGMTRYDMVGKGEYKKKYGGKPICVPWARHSSFPFLELLRNGASSLSGLNQRIKGMWKR